MILVSPDRNLVKFTSLWKR